MAESKLPVDEEHVGLRTLVTEREGVGKRTRVCVVVVRVSGQRAAWAGLLGRQPCSRGNTEAQ